MRWCRPRTALAILGLLSSVACAGKSCSCIDPLPGGFPVAERHQSAIQVRATSAALAYLSANGPALIPKLLPMGTTFSIPPSCTGANKVCCGMPTPMCRLSFDFKALSLTTKPPNALHLSTDLVLKTLDNFPIDASLLGIPLHCVISIDTTRTGSPTMNLAADLQFPVNATTNLTGLSTQNAAINGIDDGDLNFNEAGSDGGCAVVDFVLFKGIVVGILQSQFASQIGSVIDGQVCMKCASKPDCNSFASDCKSGVCVGADGKTCIQEIGLEGKLNLGKVLASVSPGLSAYVDLLVAAGGYAGADTGLSLGMLGGSLPDPHSACVPKLPPPAPVMVQQSTTFDTDFLPDGATPYHLGIGVHQSFLDTFGYAAFDSGTLCLSIGAPTVPQLTTGTVGVVIPSVADLVHAGNAPMFLAVKPGSPPTFTLGKGSFVTDEKTGKRSVDDPLLHIAIPNFAMDFYAFSDDRYVRVMTLSTDLNLGVSLDIDGQGHIVPLLGDLTNAFGRVYITNSHLLAESPNDLKQSFPMLLGIAIGSLVGQLKPIALPALMGLNIKPIAITSTDPGSDGRNRFLSIFADLSLATAAELPARTSAELVELSLPPTEAFAVTHRTAAAPTARLKLGGSDRAGRPLEWSYSVDDALWSPFSPLDHVEITDPRLWLQGHHHVDVRARVIGAPGTADPTPSRVDLLVDTIAPSGSYELAGGELRISAKDNVTPTDQLAYRYRTADGQLSDWAQPDRVAVGAARVVAVEAMDEAGNLGELGFHGRTTAPPSAGCGCTVGGAPSSSDRSGVLIVLAAIAGALLCRRRRAGVSLLLASIALGAPAIALGGCGHSGGLTKGDFEAPVDEIGRYSDVAARGSVFYASAYDDSVGDLAFAEIHDRTRFFGWQVVDGIDPAATADQRGSYRHGVSDPGPDVGLYTSLALTTGGAPRIAYYDRTNHALKFALGPHPWRSHTVDVGTGKEDVGSFAALSLDGHDVPSVAYVATTLSDGMGGFKSELRVATAHTALPGAAADWTITVVDSTPIRCGGLCAPGSACIQAAMVAGMPSGDPALASCTPVDTAPCSPACLDTQACIKGTCTTFEPPIKAPDLVEGTGLFAQARRTQAGALVIVYYDHSEGDLKLAAQQADGTFAVTFIDGHDPKTDVGQFASAAVGPDDVLHVAYVDAIADRLLYKAASVGAPAMAAPEVIDDGVRDDGPHSVGAGATIALDGGQVRVVYQDQQTAGLVEATGDGTWSHHDVQTGVPGYGWWPRIVSAGGSLYLSQFVYDRQNPTPLGTLQIAPLP